MSEPIEYPKALYRDHADHAIAKDEEHEARLRELGYGDFSELDHSDHKTTESETNAQTEASGDVAFLQARVENLEGLLTRAESDLTAIDIRNKELVSDLEKANATIAEHVQTIAEMEGHAEKGIAEIERLNNEVSSFQVTVNGLQEQIAKSNADVSKTDKKDSK
ncbi:hypothetical protein [Aquirhabdus parva]|uniref:Chemotaxis protein n=1 Tax=Aquirhabdus parva TaxID=2283318 RepID=A0A345PAV8_9GAMM|nr:hypothetical protein [Aquirhabdus parva]AXI01424.1 hypothetical protein HYN46_00015 [Aquirhabdus parva]AXI04370.1 hypothetical protein HYN46_16930 [Aquirhabdus parva]AXI04417.1 hypothetical protein HYN46_17185 [Aquirhabdus parva]